MLYVRFCRGWVSRGTGLLAGILFAVHPVHVEAVAGIAGRADVLCTVLFLLCLLKHRERGWTIWTLVLASLSMLAKEQGVTVLGVCAVLDVLSCRSGLGVRRSLLKLFSSILILLSIRSIALGNKSIV